MEHLSKQHGWIKTKNLFLGFLEEKKTANHDDQKLLAYTVSSSDFWGKVFIILAFNLLILHMPTIKFGNLILRIGISGSKDSKSR